MTDLKLRALDAADLEVVSAQLQDAVLLIRDLVYEKPARRFVAIVNRFDWSTADKAQHERRRTAVRFEKVDGAQVQGIELGSDEAVLNLLAIQFEETDAPSGFVTLTFAAGGAIRLAVECVECEVRDLGAAWRTRQVPSHEEDKDASA